ncbi:hypothetical protein [Pelagibius sp.]|uniref:hypothetical protein n=1 Tax=Pelagibius sp. TaxID=1931238 RepID=UPI003BAF832E
MLACMSFVEGIARDALVGAHRDVGKGRRLFLLIAGLMALVHLLTVHPYLRISTETAGLEASIAQKTAILDELAPELEQLARLQKNSREALKSTLERATTAMIKDFKRLGEDIKAFRDGSALPDTQSPAGLGGQIENADEATRQRYEEPAAPQSAASFDQFQQMRAPEDFDIPQQMALGSQRPGPGVSRSSEPPPQVYIDATLHDILSSTETNRQDTTALMSAYAERMIVNPAYERAHNNWDRNIRPPYLAALDSAAAAARKAASALPENSEALESAAVAMENERTAVVNLVISPDQRLDETFESDWWGTTGGKAVFADAVVSTIAKQLTGDELLAQPFAAVGESLNRQEAVRASLLEKRDALEQQFTEQRKQLAALAGASAVVPIDLRSFISLFPLVLGLVLGLAMLRVGQARREAAQALEDLSSIASSDERDSHLWLGRRVLGGRSNAAAPSIETGLVTGLVVIWIVWSAVSVLNSPLEPPIGPAVSALLGSAIVVIAAAWDIRASRKLAAAVTAEADPG